MRGKILLLCLGIAFIMIVSLLVDVLWPAEKDKVLLDLVLGKVGAGNVSFWHLAYGGFLLVELTSITGDADLYVFDEFKPYYELEEAALSSTTCGLDVVSIPAEFPRIFGIGVFGHWANCESKFKMEIYRDHTVVLSDEEFKALERLHAHTGELEIYRKQNIPPYNRKENKQSFMKFLDVLKMIFEMVMV